MTAVAVDRALASSLDAGLDAMGLDLAAGARTQLLGYLHLLDKWNRVYNLTAIREPAKMLTHHLLDSLSILPALDPLADGPVRVLDVGSGAGLPGVPIALARPDWQVDMLEPVHKKATFIAQALAELRIANARALPVRVEDHHASPYTIVVSRAFADVASFAASAARHLAPNGRLVAMKGVYPHEELQELDERMRVEAVMPVQVPGVEAARHLVFARPVAA
jgi:16S rRNA (guanine527-N7)-methyltransferase